MCLVMQVPRFLHHIRQGVGRPDFDGPLGLELPQDEILRLDPSRIASLAVDDMASEFDIKEVFATMSSAIPTIW